MIALNSSDIQRHKKALNLRAYLSDILALSSYTLFGMGAFGFSDLEKRPCQIRLGYGYYSRLYIDGGH